MGALLPPGFLFSTEGPSPLTAERGTPGTTGGILLPKLTTVCSTPRPRAPVSQPRCPLGRRAPSVPAPAPFSPLLGSQETGRLSPLASRKAERVEPDGEGEVWIGPRRPAAPGLKPEMRPLLRPAGMLRVSVCPGRGGSGRAGGFWRWGGGVEGEGRVGSCSPGSARKARRRQKAGNCALRRVKGLPSSLLPRPLSAWGGPSEE